MEKSDLLVLMEEQTSLKEEWRCVSTTLGGQCVMTVGILVMQQWFAVNLTFAELVLFNEKVEWYFEVWME